MDLIKQYIVQSITTASSNLRLNNQRIEVIAMLKDVILKSKDINHDLNQMKKITELSKFAIKLSEMHQYLNQGSIDYLKITDKFKEHSYNLIKEISRMLDMVNPYTFKETIDRIIVHENKVIEIIIEPESTTEKVLSEKLLADAKENKDIYHSTHPPIRETVSARGETESNNSQPFNGFETIILKPIKSIDSFLNELSINSEIPDEIEKYSNLMSANSELAFQNGFEILARMHEIASLGLLHLKNRTLVPSKEVIESLRACLIVIVAVVKSKEVDVKNYLNRAEVFGKFLQKIQSEEPK